MCPASNERANAVGRRAGLAPVGGSDAHTLASVANAYTVVPGAASRQEFLDGLRRGFTVAAGCSGSYARLTADIARVFAGLYRDQARQATQSASHALRFALLLAATPLAAVIPAVAAWTYANEHLFAVRQYRRFEAGRTAAFRAVRPGRFGPSAAPRPAGSP